MSVLIITHTQDNESIEMVSQAIERRGEVAIRFDTDRFPTEVQLDLLYSGDVEKLILSQDGQQFDLSHVSGVWYRRLNVGGRIPARMDEQFRVASIQESRATIFGLIASLRAFHLDAIPTIRRVENKQLQLQVAREIGLDTPRTLITNQPAAVREFALTCEAGTIAKMMASFAIYDEQGQERVVFTNRMSADDLANLDGLKYCPMTFQELLPKELELRVTIVGKQVFCAAVNSQKLDNAKLDWRKEGIALIDAWYPYRLPTDLEAKLLQFMDYFGLNYGGIDIIVTPDGRYVFLEVNPVGEFFWLELYAGLPISHAIAELLLNSQKLVNF
jgi:MvdD family ATP-grasp ribosomal peptide maturase